MMFGLADFAEPKACEPGLMLLRVAEGRKPYHCVRPAKAGLGESSILTQMRFGCDPLSAGCVGGPDTGPTPWFCYLPSWAQTTAETNACAYAGMVSGQPASPAIPPFLGPGQTPDDVIAATQAATQAAQAQAAAEQAAQQQAQIDAARNPDQPGGTNFLLVAGLIVAGAFLLGRVV